MKAHAGLEDRLAEVAFAVAVAEKRLGLGVIGVLATFGPLGHLGDEDIELAVTVNIADLKRVGMDQRPADQVVPDPALRLRRVALALVPFHRTGAIAGRDDDLREPGVLDEASREDQAADVADPRGPPLAGFVVRKHVVAGKDLGPAISIDIVAGHALGVLARAFPRGAAEDAIRGPFVAVSRIGRNVGDEERAGPLVPVGDLRLASALEVGDALVVVLGLAGFLDRVPLPPRTRLPVRAGIAPPPDAIALPVAAEDQVGPAVAVDVVHGPSSFNGQEVRLDDQPVPALAPEGRYQTRAGPMARKPMTNPLRPLWSRSATRQAVCCVDLPGAARSPFLLERCLHPGSEA